MGSAGDRSAVPRLKWQLHGGRRCERERSPALDPAQARARPERVWTSRRCCPPDGCRALPLHCSLSRVGYAHLPSAAQAALEITPEMVPNTVGKKCCHPKESARIVGELQQSERGGLAMISSCSCTLQLVPRGGCRQVFGLLVFSCLEGDGENPAPENIFLWKTKGRNIYTIFYRVILPSSPDSHHCELTSRSCLRLIRVTSQMNGKPSWSANAFVWRECGSTPVFCIWIREWEDKSYKPREIQRSSRAVRGWLQVLVCLHCSAYQRRDAFQLLVLFIKTGKTKNKYKLKAGLYFTETLANCSDWSL